MIVKVNGVKYRALIDSDAGSSYASAKLLDMLQLTTNANITPTKRVILSQLAKMYDPLVLASPMALEG